MEFGSYDRAMRSQVARLFSYEYRGDEREFARHLDDLYEHPFQRHRCLPVVAINGSRVVGFQGLFHWPYKFGGRTYRSLQAGDSLIHHDFRGRGIFQQLLEYADEHVAKLGAHFMVGFSNKASRNSYVRNKWQNILDLQWYVKIINPITSLFRMTAPNLSDQFDCSREFEVEERETFRLSNDADFTNWRADYSADTTYACYSWTGKHRATFALKFSTRRKYLRELIIGDFRCETNDAEVIFEAFESLILKTQRLKSISILTIALNSNSNALSGVIGRLGFRPINKRIHFIVKDLSGDASVYKPELWNPSCADIDVW